MMVEEEAVLPGEGTEYRNLYSRPRRENESKIFKICNSRYYTLNVINIKSSEIQQVQSYNLNGVHIQAINSR